MNDEFNCYESLEALEAEIGKKLPNKKVFTGDSEFQAMTKAEVWLGEHCFSIGRMCWPEPVGIKRGKWDIMKWKNLSSQDRKKMDGVIVGEFRNGPVTVYYAE